MMSKPVGLMEIRSRRRGWLGVRERGARTWYWRKFASSNYRMYFALVPLEADHLFIYRLGPPHKPTGRPIRIMYPTVHLYISLGLSDLLSAPQRMHGTDARRVFTNLCVKYIVYRYTDRKSVV